MEAISSIQPLDSASADEMALTNPNLAVMVTNPTVVPVCPFDDLSIEIIILIYEALTTDQDAINFALAYRPAYATYKRYCFSIMRSIASSVIHPSNVQAALTCLLMVRRPEHDVDTLLYNLRAEPPKDFSFMDLSSLWELVRLASRVNYLSEFFLYAPKNQHYEKFWKSLYAMGHDSRRHGRKHSRGPSAQPVLFHGRRDNFASINRYFWRVHQRSRQRAKMNPITALAPVAHQIYQLEMRSRYLALFARGYLLPPDMGGEPMNNGMFRFIVCIESVFHHLIQQLQREATTSDLGKLARLGSHDWIRARCSLGTKLWSLLVKNGPEGITRKLGMIIWREILKLTKDERVTAKLPRWYNQMNDPGLKALRAHYLGMG